MLIDLHCHTRPLSSCSALTVEDVVAGARRAGLDGVCLTEHDRLWPLDEVRRLGERHGLVVLRGMEITTEVGHVLVFGMDQPPPLMFLARQLAEAVALAGGFMALAHPARSGQPPLPPAMIGRLFHAVETINGTDGPAQNQSAAHLARLTHRPGIGGSDCHAFADIGRAATRFHGPVRTEADLVTALRAGAYAAEALGDCGGRATNARRAE
ncbi:MAG: PHP domain-containing protein [Dehalococcoidia bacterium]